MTIGNAIRMHCRYANICFLKILQVVPFISSRSGGPAVFVAESAVALAGLGVSTKILATNLGQVPSSGNWRPIEKSELPADIEALDLEMFSVERPKRLAYSPTLAARLDEIAREFDVIHIHSLWLHTQFAAQRVARKQRVPYIVSPHGALDPFLRSHGRARKALATMLWQRRMLYDASLLHITTEVEGELIADIAPDVPRWVVPCGVWADRLATPGDANRFRRRFLDAADGPVVLFLGRITFKKGLDVLIKAFELFSDQGGVATLAIVGPDDEGLLPSLMELANRSSVGDRIRFLGPLYGQDRADALAVATVWALTSYTENFGIAVVEALATGLPVVVSSEVNIASDIQRNGAGIMVDLNPESSAKAMLDLVANADRRAALSLNAKGYASRFDWRTVAPELKSMYESLA